MARRRQSEQGSARVPALVAGVAAAGAGLGAGLSLVADPVAVTAGVVAVAAVVAAVFAATHRGSRGGGHSGEGWETCPACTALSHGPRAFRQALAQSGRGPARAVVVGLVRFSSTHGLGRAMECDLLARVARFAAGEPGLYRLPGDRLVVVSRRQEPALRPALRALLDRANGELDGAVVAAGISSGGPLPEVFERADAALRAAAGGGGGFVERSPGDAPEPPLTQNRADELRRLVTTPGAIGVAYQPVVALATGRVIGYEALMRPRGGKLDTPTAAFALAGRVGLTALLDRACRDAVLADAPGLDMRSDELLFLNIAPEAFVDPGLDPTALVAAVRGAGLVPQRVVLEISDRGDVEPRDLARVAEVVRELGFRVALDDVGDHASRLETLRLCRTDYLKLDEALTRAAARDRQSLALFRSLCALANEAGCTLVAEGVETEALLRFVDGVVGHALGPLTLEAVQGYHLGRPAPRPQPAPEEEPGTPHEPAGAA